VNGELLQERIYRGYAQAAAHAGRAYEQFRSASAIDPMAAGNSLGNIDCLFAGDPQYAMPVKYKIPTRYLYADGTRLAQRDIIVGHYGTMFVADMQPNLAMQVVRCNDLVAINRPAYIGTELQDGDFIASAMPAFRQFKQVEQKSVTGFGGAQNSATPMGNFWLFLPIEPNLVQQGDIVTDQNGMRYTLDTYDNTEIGVILTIRQAEPST
jgi:hypothetical protein